LAANLVQMANKNCEVVYTSFIGGDNLKWFYYKGNT